MGPLDKLYRKENYIIQKSISIEDKLFTELKYIVEHSYDATVSDAINIAIEEMALKKNIEYYPKPESEITIYRSIMFRKENWETLKRINKEQGISITRLVNIAIKRFIALHKGEKEENKSA